MSVTEIATLRLTFPLTWGPPEVQAFFETLSVQQVAWSGYPLRFFENTPDARVVYLITGWKSVDAHLEWIASEQNQKLLKRAKDIVEVAELEHIELDSEIANAPFVVLKEWELQGGGSDAKAGAVLDKEGVVASLQAYQELEEGCSAEGDSKKTIIMQRLELKAP